MYQYHQIIYKSRKYQPPCVNALRYSIFGYIGLLMHTKNIGNPSSKNYSVSFDSLCEGILTNMDNKDTR